jgi:protein involved in polysaccharide export with SLBB domain
MSPTPSVPTPGNLVNNNESYILGPGDIIQTNFFNVPEYNGTVQVMPDGTVNLPVVGSVTVSGMTLKQAGEAIGAQYASELNYLVVSVSLVQPRPLQIALVGEIAQPGLYSIAANAGGQFPAVVQAIQTAGGATQAANLQQVEIRRRDQAGRVRTMTVNLLALLQQGDLSQNSLLQDGDVIFIPAATEIRLADANQLAISNLRSTTDIPLDVSVVGEVLRPGPYRMEGGGGRSTLVQAIQQAGGFTPSADLSQIQLRRKTRQGTEQVVNINLWQVLQTGDLEQDLVLQQGDTVMIPTARELTATETAALTGSSLSTGSIRVNILGEVESPGAQELQANTTLNQALLSAGGFNGRARGKVKLIRFNPNGTLAQQEINIDLTQELNSATNPILRNNDVILVGRSTGARLRDTLSEVLDIFGLISPLIPF